MNKPKLEASVAFWEQSVAHDRTSIKYDLGMFGGGALLTGLGIGAAICGYPEGLLALPSGGAIGFVGLKDLSGDIEALSGSTTTLTARRRDLEQQVA